MKRSRHRRANQPVPGRSAVYSMLKHGTAYVQQGLGAYEQQYRRRSAAALARRARELGYELVPVTNVSYTLRGHERDIFEPLEIERHQRFQALGVGC